MRRGWAADSGLELADEAEEVREGRLEDGSGGGGEQGGDGSDGGSGRASEDGSVGGAERWADDIPRTARPSTQPTLHRLWHRPSSHEHRETEREAPSVRQCGGQCVSQSSHGWWLIDA